MSLIAGLLEEDFASLKGFILVKDKDWAKIKEIMKFWLNAEEGKDYFPTASHVTKFYFKIRRNNSEYGDVNNTIDADNLEEQASGKISKGRHLDKKFLYAVNAILPPRGCAGKRYDTFWETAGNITKKQINTIKKNVMTSWKVNRTMFDPDWTQFMKGKVAVNEFNPVAEVGSSFLYSTGVFNYLSCTERQVGDMNFFQCTSLFFWKTSQALIKLVSAGMLSMEINKDSVINLCRSIKDENPDRKFHRIFLSNIPDYIGYLSVFTEVAPLLHTPTTIVPSLIQSNVLYNCQSWQNYSHYIYSATGIPTLEDVTKILNLRYFNHDSVWIYQNQWTWCTKKSTGKATREEFTLWLHRVLIFSLLPPMRASDNIKPSENFALNVATFFRVCTFCIEQLGYPIHWVGCIIDEIITSCSTGIFKSKAEIPVSSPVVYRANNKQKSFCTTPFRLELLSQVDLWVGHYEKYLIPIAITPRGQCRKYRLVLWPESDNECLDTILRTNGNQSNMCLGFILSKHKNKDDFGDIGDMLEFFPEILGTAGKIRTAAIEGDNSIHLFSCMNFDRDGITGQFFIEFHMNENDFRKYLSYYVCLFRSDSWDRLRLWHTEEGKMRLKDAKCVPF